MRWVGPVVVLAMTTSLAAGMSVLGAGTARADPSDCDVARQGPGVAAMSCGSGPGLVRVSAACYPSSDRSGPGRAVVGPWVSSGQRSVVACGPGQQVDHIAVQRQGDATLPPGPV